MIKHTSSSMSEKATSSITQVADISNRPKSLERILDEQIDESCEEYSRSDKALFLSALTAGLDLGFSLVVMGVLYTLFRPLVSEELIFAVLALGYPVGLLFVVLGRSALFTEHTTLAILPVLARRRSLWSMLCLWLIIYGGTILGGIVIALLVVALGPQLGAVSEEAITAIGHHLTRGSAWVILGSGVLAGWLMGLLSWLVTSSQETISRIFIVVLITFVIGLGGFHHCIVGSTELFAATLLADDLGVGDYFFTQSMATLGNIIGGVFFVGILRFQITQN